MNKQEFFARLRKGLSGLPQDEIEERITFYGEMIEDGIEEGLSEEEAVAAVGSVDEIVKQTVAEIPLSKIAKERIKPKRRLKAWEIVPLVIGFPPHMAVARCCRIIGDSRAVRFALGDNGFALGGLRRACGI